MKAIQVKYHGPTDYRGSRYIATMNDSGHRTTVTISQDYAFDADDNAAIACEALMAKLGWEGQMIGGWFKDAWYFVFNTSDPVAWVKS